MATIDFALTGTANADGKVGGLASTVLPSPPVFIERIQVTIEASKVPPIESPWVRLIFPNRYPSLDPFDIRVDRLGEPAELVLRLSSRVIDTTNPRCSISTEGFVPGSTVTIRIKCVLGSSEQPKEMAGVVAEMRGEGLSELICVGVNNGHLSAIVWSNVLRAPSDLAPIALFPSLPSVTVIPKVFFSLDQEKDPAEILVDPQLVKITASISLTLREGSEQFAQVRTGIEGLVEPAVETTVRSNLAFRLISAVFTGQVNVEIVSEEIVNRLFGSSAVLRIAIDEAIGAANEQPRFLADAIEAATAINFYLPEIDLPGAYPTFAGFRYRLIRINDSLRGGLFMTFALNLQDIPSPCICKESQAEAAIEQTDSEREAVGRTYWGGILMMSTIGISREAVGRILRNSFHAFGYENIGSKKLGALLQVDWKHSLSFSIESVEFERHRGFVATIGDISKSGVLTVKSIAIGGKRVSVSAGFEVSLENVQIAWNNDREFPRLRQFSLIPTVSIERISVNFVGRTPPIANEVREFLTSEFATAQKSSIETEIEKQAVVRLFDWRGADSRPYGIQFFPDEGTAVVISKHMIELSD